MENHSVSLAESSLSKDLKNGRETVWINPARCSVTPMTDMGGKRYLGIQVAQTRLMRFLPYVAAAYPETAARKGILESRLVSAENLAQHFRAAGAPISGRVYIKDDSAMPITGSVKARGGIYAVFAIAEALAIKEKLIKNTDDHALLCAPECKEFFHNYSLHVVSDGNLAIAVGAAASNLGFQTTVHVSDRVPDWCLEMLKTMDATIHSYSGGKKEAQREVQALADADPNCYCIDGTESEDIFMGCASAALRIKMQFMKNNITPDSSHPVFVYLPCGSGLTAGGLTFGLRQIFGDSVHCFFAEPAVSPTFTCGIISKGSDADDAFPDSTVWSIAEELHTEQPSANSMLAMETLISGTCTVSEEHIQSYTDLVDELEQLPLEPSACIGVQGIAELQSSDAFQNYLKAQGLSDCMDNAVHIIWATGESHE